MNTTTPRLFQRASHRCAGFVRIAVAALLVISLVISLGFTPGELLAADSSAAKPATGTLSFARLYTGPDGISHFANEKLQLNAAGTEGMAALLAIHPIGDVKGAQFAMLKAGTTEDWHPAPRRQFMICLRGIVEVTAGDGQKRTMKPGEFMLLEDTTGKGHITHIAGSEDHVALAVPVADGAFTRPSSK